MMPAVVVGRLKPNPFVQQQQKLKRYLILLVFLLMQSSVSTSTTTRESETLSDLLQSQQTKIRDAVRLREVHEESSSTGSASSSIRPSIIIGDNIVYQYAYSQYGRGVAAILNKMQRELKKGPNSSSDHDDAETKAFYLMDHMISLSNLLQELGIIHMDNYHTHSNVEDHKRGEASLESSLALNRVSLELMILFEESYQYEALVDMGFDGFDKVKLIATGAAICQHICEAILSDPLLEEETTESHGTSPSDSSAIFLRALSLSRQSVEMYGNAAKEFVRNDDDDKVTLIELQLGIGDACMSLGRLIVKCYEMGLTDHVIASRTGTDKEIDAGALKEANDLFEETAALYRYFVEADDRDEMLIFFDEAYLLLADALHEIGVVSIYLSNFPRSISAWEEALKIYTSLENEGFIASSEKDSISITVGETLQSLSDVMLQSAEYDKAREYYKKAMARYSENGANLHPQNSQQQLYRLNKSNTKSDSDAIQIYEDALQQYYEESSAFGDSVEILIDGGLSSSAENHNELYEAYLLSNLGAFYLSDNQMELAEEKLTKALKLYEEHLDEDEEVLGDTYLNLAYVMFNKEDYDESNQLYGAAIQIYESVSPNSNPFDEDGRQQDSTIQVDTNLINVDELLGQMANITI